MGNRRSQFEAFHIATRDEGYRIDGIVARAIREGTLGSCSPHRHRKIMELSEVADYFDAAAAYVKDRGWTKGSWGQDGGPRCAIGAITSVTPPPVYETVRQAFAWALVAQGSLRLPTQAVAIWNDTVCSSKEELMAAFKAAAIYIRESLYEEAQVGRSFEEVWAQALPAIQEKAIELAEAMTGE